MASPNILARSLLFLLLLPGLQRLQAQTESEQLTEHCAQSLKMNDYRAALSDCNQLIKADTNSFAAWTNRSLCYIRLLKADSALADAEHALQLVPGSGEPGMNKAIALFMLKRFKESIVLLQTLEAKYPAYCKSYVIEAQNQFELKDFNKAKSLIDKAIKCDPASALAWACEAALQKATDPLQHKKIIADLDSALKYAPDEMHYLFENAQEHFLSGDFKNAEALANKIIGHTHLYCDVYYIRGLARVSSNDVKGGCEDLFRATQMGYDSATEKLALYCPEKAKLHTMFISLHQAWKADSAGRYEDALKILDEVSRAQPQSADVRAYKGEVLLQLGDTTSAFEQYEACKKIDPYYSIAYAATGTLLVQQARYTLALPDLDMAIKLRSDLPYLYASRALANMNLHEFQSSLTDLNKSLELDPDDAYLHSFRATIFGLLNKNKEALQDLNEAIRLNPKSAYYLSRARLYYAMHDAEKCLNDLDVYLIDFPKASDILLSKVNLLVKLKRFKEVELVLTQLISLNAKDPFYYLMRGDFRRDSKNLKGAIADFTKVIELNPVSGEAYYKRGSTKFGAGDQPGSCKDLKEAARLGFPGAQRAYTMSCQ